MFDFDKKLQELKDAADKETELSAQKQARIAEHVADLAKSSSSFLSKYAGNIQISRKANTLSYTFPNGRQLSVSVSDGPFFMAVSDMEEYNRELDAQEVMEAIIKFAQY